LYVSHRRAAQRTRIGQPIVLWAAPERSPRGNRIRSKEQHPHRFSVVGHRAQRTQSSPCQHLTVLAVLDICLAAAQPSRTSSSYSPSRRQAGLAVADTSNDTIGATVYPINAWEDEDACDSAPSGLTNGFRHLTVVRSGSDRFSFGLGRSMRSLVACTRTAAHLSRRPIGHHRD